MSTMSARKTQRVAGRSQEVKTGKAYRRLAAKAWRSGDENRADQLLDLSHYWTARANCNRDKDYALDGAVMVVNLTGAI